MFSDQELSYFEKQCNEERTGEPSFVRKLIDEIRRLKRGDFTEEEFQDLCHNFSPDDVCRFKAGCEEYQRKLFGDKA